MKYENVYRYRQSVWELKCFTYLWARSSSCTAPPPRRVFCPTACKGSRTQSGWCCGTSQSPSSSLAPPSPQSTALRMSPGRRRTWGPGPWGLPVGKQWTFNKNINAKHYVVRESGEISEVWIRWKWKFESQLHETSSQKQPELQHNKSSQRKYICKLSRLLNGEEADHFPRYVGQIIFST